MGTVRGRSQIKVELKSNIALRCSSRRSPIFPRCQVSPSPSLPSATMKFALAALALLPASAFGESSSGA